MILKKLIQTLLEKLKNMSSSLTVYITSFYYKEFMKNFSTVAKTVKKTRGRALEKYDFEFRQNYKNACTFRQIRLILNNLFPVQKHTHFNWETFLQFKRC